MVRERDRDKERRRRRRKEAELHAFEGTMKANPTVFINFSNLYKTVIPKISGT